MKDREECGHLMGAIKFTDGDGTVGLFPIKCTKRKGHEHRTGNKSTSCVTCRHESRQGGFLILMVDNVVTPIRERT